MQALRPSARSSIAAASGAVADILLQDNDCIKLGSLEFRVIATPGHTNGCLCFYLPPSSAGGPGLVFTGDALLIRGCGRTDFQQGEAAGRGDAAQAEPFSYGSTNMNRVLMLLASCHRCASQKRESRCCSSAVPAAGVKQPKCSLCTGLPQGWCISTAC
jgi:hypothetical protein